MIKSSRGHPLTYALSGYADRPVVAVEVYCKWYELFLVHPNGRVEAVPFPDDDLELYAEIGPPYLDHAPNPRYVAIWAERRGYYLCDVAEEILIGRWEIEYYERKRYPCPEGQ